MDEFEPSAVELQLLTEACRLLDELDELRRPWPAMARQSRAHGADAGAPGLGELRQGRAELRRLLDALGIPASAVSTATGLRRGRVAERVGAATRAARVQVGGVQCVGVARVDPSICGACWPSGSGRRRSSTRTGWAGSPRTRPSSREPMRSTRRAGARRDLGVSARVAAPARVPPHGVDGGPAGRHDDVGGPMIERCARCGPILEIDRSAAGTVMPLANTTEVIRPASSADRCFPRSRTRSCCAGQVVPPDPQPRSSPSAIPSRTRPTRPAKKAGKTQRAAQKSRWPASQRRRPHPKTARNRRRPVAG